jgi:hypothetical protein
MLILITVALLFGTSLATLVLQLLRRPFRFAWLAAVGAAFMAWMTVIMWRVQLPLTILFGSWGPSDLLPVTPMLAADQSSWLYAMSLLTLALATLLTATVRDGFPHSNSMMITLTVCGFGVLAATAGNPLTLGLIWAALDLTELLILLSSSGGRVASQRIVTTFSVHAAAIVLLMLAQVASSPINKPVDFSSISPQAGLLLLAAAGLRLIVLPVHLPYASEISLRRDAGTTVRLASAAASLVLLSRLPSTAINSWPAWFMLILSAAAVLYAGWMWLRAPDELAGRPFWIMGLSALAIFSGLRGSPLGATAWGAALILSGAALFVSSLQHVWLNRLLIMGVWGVSALPLSLAAAGWEGRGGILDVAIPLFVIGQALLMAGYTRHAMRPSTRTALDAQPAWNRSVYPVGIGLLILIQIILGLWGWDGAFRVGALIPSISAGLLTVVLLWAIPRFPILNPVPAHWLQGNSGSRLDRAYLGLQGIYGWLESISRTISDVLEGEAGLMWTLLFLVLFVVMMVQRKP